MPCRLQKDRPSIFCPLSPHRQSCRRLPSPSTLATTLRDHRWIGMPSFAQIFGLQSGSLKALSAIRSVPDEHSKASLARLLAGWRACWFDGLV
mmetsp:Transcript_11666/g.22984  ORF Transcript_11666/g.22984 Transcript_11666/m.22984 type:complete len:93 (-) Transcript_11666:873-1151(-)